MSLLVLLRMYKPTGKKYIIINQLLKKFPEGDKGHKFTKIQQIIQICKLLLKIFSVKNNSLIDRDKK